MGREGDDRRWDGWMASPSQWTWVWVNAGSFWWTRRPGVLQSMGSQRVRHDWVTELNWTGEWGGKNLAWARSTSMHTPVVALWPFPPSSSPFALSFVTSATFWFWRTTNRACFHCWAWLWVRKLIPFSCGLPKVECKVKLSAWTQFPHLAALQLPPSCFSRVQLCATP